ncbi:TetR/AcrR family transcriptional regulator [Candidatus Cloacimonadota bacterium]
MKGRKHLTEDERDERKLLIMNTLERMFIDVRIEDFDLTVENIAKKAGLAKGTIYLYYRSKDEMVFDSYIRSLKLKEKMLVNTLAPIQDPLERFKAFLDFYYRFFKEYPQYLKLQIYCEGANIYRQNVKRDQTQEYLKIARSTRAIIRQIIQECVDEGYFRKELNVILTLHNIPHSLRGIIHVCLFTFNDHYMHTDYNESADNFYNNFVEILLKGVMA